MGTSPLNADPSRTTPLRKKFLADFARRFNRIKRAVVKLIDEEDALGLKDRILGLKLNTRWKFKTDDSKLAAFQEWFRIQIDSELLRVDSSTGEPWTAKYVHSAHLQGVTRAFIDVRKDILKLDKSSDFFEGSREEFLRAAFNQPEMVSKLKLLSTRTFEDLKGVTAQMSADMGRILTDGMAKGSNPRVIARELAKGVDISRKRAERIARTEIIHAHAEGQLDGLEELGVEEVEAQVEWAAARDNRVCPRCASMSGNTYSIKEARGLIPLHPNCRCAWIPANVGEERVKPRRRKKVA